MKLKYIAIGLFVLGISALTSCQSDSDENDEVVEITRNDLMGKDWFVNTMYNNGARFDIDEGLEVYHFRSGDILDKQEYGGRRIFQSGTWALEDNKLIIREDGGEKQWYIVPPSTSNHIYLNDKNAVRQLVSGVAELDELFADAWVVNEYYDLGQVSGYRYDVLLKGNNIKEAIVLLENGGQYPLVHIGGGHWALASSGVIAHTQRFDGEGVVQFYVKFKSGYVTKLDDTIYSHCVGKLDYQSVIATHAVNSQKVTVSWLPLDDENVYYRVEILKNVTGESVADENHPVFVSRPQSPGADGLNVVPGIDSALDNLSELKVGDPFYVKVVAYRFEPGLDLDNFRYEDVNIQSSTQFIYPMGAW